MLILWSLTVTPAPLCNNLHWLKQSVRLCHIQIAGREAFTGMTKPDVSTIVVTYVGDGGISLSPGPRPVKLFNCFTLTTHMMPACISSFNIPLLHLQVFCKEKNPARSSDVMIPYLVLPGNEWSKWIMFGQSWEETTRAIHTRTGYVSYWQLASGRSIIYGRSYYDNIYKSVTL